MITLNQRIILDERVIEETEKGIHHEIYKTKGTVWAHVAFKGSCNNNDSAHQSCLYSFAVRKSDRLTGCTLGRLHWNNHILYITNVFTSEKYPQYLMGYAVSKDF